LVNRLKELVIKIEEEGRFVFKMGFKLIGVEIPVRRVAVGGTDAVPVSGTPVILVGKNNLTDILLLVFPFGQGNGEAEWAVDAGDVTAVAVGGLDKIFVLLKVDGRVSEELGPVLEAGEVMEV